MLRKASRPAFDLLALIALMTLPVGAVAQDWDVLTPQLNAIEFGRQNEQSAEAASDGPALIGRAVGSNLVASLGTSVQTQAPPVRQDYAYRYDKSRTQTNLRAFVERTPDPAAKANLAQLVASQPRLMQDIRAGMSSHGFDPDDAADAYAMWWINAWLVANKRDEVPDNGTVAMVRSQVRNAFAATPDFANTSDAQRQEYAEALMLQATMLGSAFEQWKDDPKMLQQLADAARKGAQASGLDLSLMELTRNGFVPRKRADARGAAGDGDSAVRNARVDAPAPEGELSGIGLALAAGAGLAVTLLGGYALARRG